MRLILRIPEGQHVFCIIGRENQLLLIRIRRIPLDLHKFLRDHGIGRRFALLSAENRLRIPFQISNCEVDAISGNIYERVLVRPLNVHLNGVAAFQRIIACLIAFIQHAKRFRSKRLGRSGERRPCGILRDSCSIRKPVVNNVVYINVRSPLSVEIQVTVDRHGEVKRFFLVGIADVEPADKGVRFTLRIRRGIRYRCAMRDFRPCLNRFAVIVQNILRQVRFDRVGLGHPFGIEHQIGGRHGQRAKVCLGTLIATRGRVPSGEYISVLFKAIRVLRFKVVPAQRSFVLYTPTFAIKLSVIVVERQFVAIAGVAEVVIIIYS